MNKKKIEDKIKNLMDEGRNVLKGATAMDGHKLSKAEKIKKEILILRRKLKEL